MRIGVTQTGGPSSEAVIAVLNKNTSIPAMPLKYHDLPQAPAEMSICEIEQSDYMALVKKTVAEQIEGLNYIILPGNNKDIDPALYHQQRADTTEVNPDPRRALFERELLRQADNRGIPVFGICGGMQQLAVFHGATMNQHIDGQDQRKFEAAKPLHHWVHRIKIAKGTELAAGSRNKTARVNSLHHQHIETLGDQLVAAATHTCEGNIEAVEARHHRAPLWGTQFHPELHLCDPTANRFFNHKPSQKIFEAIIQGAKTHAGKAALLHEIKTTGFAR